MADNFLEYTHDMNAWPWDLKGGGSEKYDDIHWPRISIVTPSYNQGEYIEDTIRSVLLQGYPNLEYIIIDGGSQDNSVEIIKKYEKYLSYWVSEVDRGQSHAINKGFEHATGEIFCWLNSDDYFLPGSLKLFSQHYSNKPICVAWAGIGVRVDKYGNVIGEVKPKVDGDINFLADWCISSRIFQPACAFNANTFNEVEGLDENLHYAMDFDLWLRLRMKGKISSINHEMACARLYPEIKTLRNLDLSNAETIHACIKYGLYQGAESRIKLVKERAVSLYIAKSRLSTLEMIKEIFHRQMKIIGFDTR